MRNPATITLTLVFWSRHLISVSVYSLQLVTCLLSEGKEWIRLILNRNCFYISIPISGEWWTSTSSYYTNFLQIAGYPNYDRIIDSSQLKYLDNYLHLVNAKDFWDPFLRESALDIELHHSEYNLCESFLLSHNTRPPEIVLYILMLTTGR